MFHHFPGELLVEDYLVSSTNLIYHQQKSLTYLKSISNVGYLDFRSKTLPPVDFQYSRFPTDAALSKVQVQEVQSASLDNLPAGVDGSNYQWTDLNGEGLPGVLVEGAEGWFYKRNLSANNQVSLDTVSMTVPRLGPLEVVYPKPPLSQSSSKGYFSDVKGDGLLDFVRIGSHSWGYSSRRFDPGLSWLGSIP
jgi:hypothetical protein